jgi:hypothetical protein
LIGCLANEAAIYGKTKKYFPSGVFQYMNLSTRGLCKWFKHARDLLNMIPLRHLMIGLVILLLCETMLTKKKCALAVDTNHGLNLRGIDVILEMVR